MHRPARLARHVRPGRDRWAAAVTVGVVFLVCAALLLRHPAGGPAWRTVWAEDGTEFLRCPLEHDFWSCVSTPYTGYLQFGPRVLAPFVTLLPVRDWAVGAALAAVIGAAVSLTVVYWASAWLIPSRVVRALGVAVIAASAAAHWEPAGNLANLHWFLFLSGVLLAADRDSSDARAWTALRAAWLAGVCLSEALGPAVLLAYAVGLVLRRYRRGSWRLSDAVGGAVVAVAVAVQLVEYYRFPRRPAPAGGGETVRRALTQYRQMVLHDGWMGPTQGGREFARVMIVVTVVLLVVGVAGCVVAARRRSVQARFALPLVAGVVLALASVVDWEVNVLVNNAVGPRYILVPFGLVVLAALTVLSNLYALSGVRRTVAVPVLAGAVALACLVAVAPYRPLVATDQPGWHGQLALARQRCAVPGVPASTLESIRIAPHVGWSVTVSCGRILH